jgi:phosphoglycolate phosphatase-like HAD superfamily hydrolase
MVNGFNAARANLGFGPLDVPAIASYVGNGAPVLIRKALGAEADKGPVVEALGLFSIFITLTISCIRCCIQACARPSTHAGARQDAGDRHQQTRKDQPRHIFASADEAAVIGDSYVDIRTVRDVPVTSQWWIPGFDKNRPDPAVHR